MQQLTLFDAPRTTTRTESKRAGRSARNDSMPAPNIASADRATVLAIVRAAGERGTTSSEIAEQLGKPKNAFSGRITELVEAGLVFRRQGVRRGKDSVIFAKGYE